MVYSSCDERLTFQSLNAICRANIRDLSSTVVLKIVLSDIVAHLYEGHLRLG